MGNLLVLTINKVLKMNTIAKKILFTFLSIVFSVFSAFSQIDNTEEVGVVFSLPPVAILDIEPATNSNVVFSVSPATEPGALPRVDKTSNEELWLNYSCSHSNSQGGRSVIAQIGDGNLPDGILLKLKASNYRGISGDGKFGQSNGEVSLSTQPQTIIHSVGNCYTGDGTGNGHLLSFSLEISDYSKLNKIGESSLTILYTISDN